MSVVKCTSLWCAGLVHGGDDVLGAVDVDRPEEIVALGAYLDRRQHLGRQIVDHVVGADADRRDRGRIGDVGVTNFATR